MYILYMLVYNTDIVYFRRKGMNNKFRKLLSMVLVCSHIFAFLIIGISEAPVDEGIIIKPLNIAPIKIDSK